MKVLALLLITFSLQLSEVGRSAEGVLKAGIANHQERVYLNVSMSNMQEADRIVLHTTNHWKISLDFEVYEGQKMYYINPIQCSILKEEEILKYVLSVNDKTYEYQATNRSFLKNRLSR